MISCFGYIRVSTQRQGEGVSLEAQKSAIEQCAQQRGLLITEWFQELETASKAGRPVFNNMTGRLKRGHAEGLVVHKLDRSARNLRDWNTVSELMDHGIAFHIATEPIDFSTRGGRMTADFLAVIAADFSRNQREETIKGLNGRLKQGLFPFKAPLGYLDQGKGQPKTPCPERAPMIQEMYELYASGEYSLKSLQVEMELRGLRNHHRTALSLHGIEKILSNPFYLGQILIARTGETFDGIHEPIITKAA
jgi:DNA invertase Pin-like site-specific DNA recombinase